eukprot:evm.model.scf_543EXC.4 EVM.evm.TU.scf_543EXC.4   scf_543EXC:20816-21271(+)
MLSAAWLHNKAGGHNPSQKFVSFLLEQLEHCSCPLLRKPRCGIWTTSEEVFVLLPCSMDVKEMTPDMVKLCKKEGGVPRIVFQTLCDIEPGQELTVDYFPGLTREQLASYEDKTLCLCRSSRCRGWVVTMDPEGKDDESDTPDSAPSRLAT